MEYGKISYLYLPPAFLRLYDGPSVQVEDTWRLLGCGASGSIVKPKLGLWPRPFGQACYSFWQGGDLIKNNEPQGNVVFCEMKECIAEVAEAMRACIKPANITADDPNDMMARGKYVLSQFGALSETCTFLVDGYVAGGAAVTCAKGNSPQTQRGYTAFVHTKISCVIPASNICIEIDERDLDNLVNVRWSSTAVTSALEYLSVPPDPRPQWPGSKIFIQDDIRYDKRR